MLGLSERQVNNNSLVKLSIRAIKVCIEFFNSNQKVLQKSFSSYKSFTAMSSIFKTKEILFLYRVFQF
jgi:hypothetical protein